MFQGKEGAIHSWVLHGDEPSKPNNGVRILEKLPLVVFVKFLGAEWKLPSLEEPGLYPIKPKSGTWFLDKGRKKPELEDYTTTTAASTCLRRDCTYGARSNEGQRYRRSPDQQRHEPHSKLCRHDQSREEGERADLPAFRAQSLHRRASRGPGNAAKSLAR